MTTTLRLNVPGVLVAYGVSPAHVVAVVVTDPVVGPVVLASATT